MENFILNKLYSIDELTSDYFEIMLKYFVCKQYLILY